MKPVLALTIILCLSLAGCGPALIRPKTASSVSETPGAGTKEDPADTAKPDPEGGSADTAVPDPEGGSADTAAPEEDPLPHESAENPAVSEDTSPETSAASSADASEVLPSGLTIADIKAMDYTSLLAYASELLKKALPPESLKNTFDNRRFLHHEGFVSYDDPAYESLTGVDVSSFQGEIDWDTLREQGISFAFIRLGFRGYGEAGTLNEDETARRNLENAKAAGLLVGAYFFSQAVTEEEAAEEADFALRILDGFPLDLPLVFDAEYIRNDEARTDPVPVSQFGKNARVFCEAVKAAGYEPMIYVNRIMEILVYDIAVLNDYPLWFAGYDAVPITPYTFAFWQYTESASLEGVGEPIDLDLWLRKTTE